MGYPSEVRNRKQTITARLDALDRGRLLPTFYLTLFIAIIGAAASRRGTRLRTLYQPPHFRADIHCRK